MQDRRGKMTVMRWLSLKTFRWSVERRMGRGSRRVNL